jgi:hypothetical protein
MRIYRRGEFLQLPAGTVYSSGVPFAFQEFCVKGDTWTNDFLTRDLVWIDGTSSADYSDRLHAMLESGESYPMQKSYGRDGSYDEEAVFLVYEPADLDCLIEVCQTAKAVAQGASATSYTIASCWGTGPHA